jgi:hypothetical protein
MKAHAVARQHRCSGRAVVLVVVAVLLLAVVPGRPVAEAFVLPGAHILELMARKLGRAETLRIVHDVTLPNPDAYAGPIQIEELRTYRYPGNLRSEVATDRVHKIRLTSGQGRLTVVDHRISPEQVDRYGAPIDLLFFRSRRRLATHLEMLGVDTALSSLGRLEGTPVFVVGARYPDRGRSQLWVDRESFLPLGMLLQRPDRFGVGPPLRCRFHDWAQFSEKWYPRRIEFHEDGKWVRSITVRSVAVDPALPPDHFDIEQLRGRFSTESRLPSEGERSRDLEEVRQTIKDFKKLYDRP